MSELFRAPTLPPPARREILRYAGCREETDEVRLLLDDCLAEALPLLTPRLCYTVLPLTAGGEDEVQIGGVRVRSLLARRHLAGCEGVMLFAATLGLALDRAIARASRLSPARAVLLGAIGAERIEALCDVFCAHAAQNYLCRTRISPGYGDLPLALQGQLFALLDCERRIGLTLTGSGLMSPTKSVSALIGLCPRRDEER